MVRAVWTYDEKELAVRLRSQGLLPIQIVNRFPGRTITQLYDMFRHLQKTRERIKARLPRTSAGQIGPRKDVPAHVLEDRERRQNAPETLNVKYLGDPAVPRWMSNADDKSDRVRRDGPWALARY